MVKERRRSRGPSIYVRGGEDPILARYFKDISSNKSWKPLTSDEELSLAKKIQKGDKKAEDALVKSNLRFVVNVALNYSNQGMPLPDLINEGNLGLIRAAKRFDPDKSFKFISYAVWWIRQAILQALADQSRISRIPVNRVAQIHKLSKAYDRLTQKNMGYVSDEDLAEELELGSVNEVDKIRRTEMKSVSLDSPTSLSSTGTMLDRIEAASTDPYSVLDRHAMKEEVKELLSSLSEREQAIIRDYFGFREGYPLILEEIGRKVGITRERVRQLKESAMKKLSQAARIRRRSGGGPIDAFIG